jgi:hypothetical protein
MKTYNILIGDVLILNGNTKLSKINRFGQNYISTQGINEISQYTHVAISLWLNH